jgi:hypothetical protein
MLKRFLLLPLATSLLACHASPGAPDGGGLGVVDAGTTATISGRKDPTKPLARPGDDRTGHVRSLFGGAGGLPDGGGFAPNHVLGDDLFYFGSGIDGSYGVTDGGACPASPFFQRDMYFTFLGGACHYSTANWKIYAWVCDFNQGLILDGSGQTTFSPNGGPGENTNLGNAFSDGGTGGYAFPPGSLPGALGGAMGGLGNITNGGGGAAFGNEPSNGGSTLTAGSGASATGGTGGLGGLGASATPYPFGTFTTTMSYGFSTLLGPLPLSGLGGPSGGGGGGNGALGPGGGGGGSGAGSGSVWISCGVVNRGPGTAQPAVVAVGGRGNKGGDSVSSLVGEGAGGGASGGSGGAGQFFYGMLEGSPVPLFFDFTGGIGGNGGSDPKGAASGNAGGGGSSGTLCVTDLTNQKQTCYPSVAGDAGSPGSGADGGIGGPPGVLQVGL